MTLRNKIGFLLILISFGLLYPGITENLITITAGFSLFGQHQEIFRETRSILQTVENLHKTGNNFVAFLILLFSVLIPVLKGLLLLTAVFIPKGILRTKLHVFVRAISKWSMADVFVIGTFVAYLAAEATSNLGAQIEHGFYWFAAYCLVSIASTQVLKVD